ncbi:MAG: hypothetical protein APF83_03310 [Lutibacter sp. BRH_c52]|nr:MAG: hypothetical protein APF83_03310 [Lutibacter sp. BRH_c52]HCE53904.1 hypothetical protein [Lutibacter sp.]
MFIFIFIFLFWHLTILDEKLCKPDNIIFRYFKYNLKRTTNLTIFDLKNSGFPFHFVMKILTNFKENSHKFID